MSIINDINNTYISAKQKAADFLSKKGSLGSGEILDGASKVRVPSGQRVVNAMVAMPPIVRTYPHVPKEEWSLKIYKNVAKELILSFEELTKLGVQEYVVDFHCVTTWSKLDQQFSGVPLSTLFKLCEPALSVKYVIFECAEGYTTNLVYQELLTNTAFLAVKMDGQDIPDRFGGPVRAVVPHLYGWKSAKHITGIRFEQNDEPGFWEVRGYNNHADPWKEERYS